MSEGLFDDCPGHRVRDVVEHVEIGHTRQPRDDHHPGVVDIDRGVPQTAVDLTTVRRRSVHRLEGIAEW